MKGVRQDAGQEPEMSKHVGKSMYREEIPPPREIGANAEKFLTELMEKTGGTGSHLHRPGV